jgi:MoaA/NifB/PqqE/SkfB family radical SAM enzyme
MTIQNVISQTLKKIISPSGVVYRVLRIFNQYITSIKRLKKRKSLIVWTHLTDHCNLNCACCNQFVPLADEGFYPIDTFKRDTLHLFQLGGGKISKFSFSSGETLLHPQITDFFDFTRECFDKYGEGGDRIYN